MYTDTIIFLGTNDLGKSSVLCEEVLGLELYKDQTKCRIYRINDSSAIGFCEHMEVANATKSPIITLVVNDVDFVYNKVVDKGIKAEKPSINEYFKIYHFFFVDENGYTYEIQKFLD